MPGLEETGRLAYNGFKFEGAHHIDAVSETVYDEDRRRAVAHRITITCRAIIANANPSTDTNLEAIRMLLGAPGKMLIFEDKGFGDDIRVNLGKTASIQDLDGGPHPEIVSWVPIGNDNACEVVWRVVTHIPPCKYARKLGITSLTWGISYRINGEGDTTRNLTGHLTIVPRRQVNSADGYRDHFAPAPILGFTREQEWILDPKKNRIDFSIVDTQIPSPNPYPQFIPKIKAKYRISWNRGRHMKRAYCTLSATMSAKAGLSPALCWQVFATLVGQRLDLARRANRSPFLLSLDVEENIFERDQSFAVRWSFLTEISEAISASGLWRPIGTDWRLWTTSLADSTFHNRGTTRLYDVPADDIVVDLCGTQGVVSPNNKTLVEVPVSPGEIANPLKNQVPDPRYSYLEFEHAAIPYRKQPVSVQKHLQKPPVDNGEGAFDLDVQGVALSDLANYGTDSGSTVPDTVTKSGAPSYGVRYVGRAIRAGHQNPRPVAKTIGKKPAIEIAQTFIQKKLATVMGVGVWGAAWVLDYVTDGNPGRILNPKDQRERQGEE